MYFEFIKSGGVSQNERIEFINVLDIQMEKLNFLIESMIKMSRLESNLINLKPNYANLSNEIITKQKGFIKVKSKKGAGSLFSVMLPIDN